MKVRNLPYPFLRGQPLKYFGPVIGGVNLDLLQMESHSEAGNFSNAFGSSFFYPQSNIATNQNYRSLSETHWH